jgi:transposase
MPKGKSNKVVFKPSHREEYQDQPLNIEELIDQDDLVRQVDRIIDQIEISPIIETYQGGGASRYHPAMLLKVLIYGYIRKMYSGRLIEKALKENVKFMWLSGMNMPDFRTLNAFLSGRLVGLMEEVLSQVSKILLEEGYITLKAISIDGTKIEANASKHSHVWSKNTERYKEGVKEKVGSLLKEIVRINKEEDEKYGDKSIEELSVRHDLTSEEIKQAADKISEYLRKGFSKGEKQTENLKKQKKAVSELKKN